MATRYEPKEIDHVLEELKNDNDRAVIIVGGSLLEHALEQLIKSRLREPASQKEASLLFSDIGIIGSFYRKILTAYFMRLIGPYTRKDFDLIRKMRNEVAHNMNPVSFDAPDIASRCRELVLAKESIPGQQMPPDLRGKFLVTIHFFSSVLMLKANDSTPIVADAVQDLNKYLDR
jgi:hypothetical protein